MRLSSACQKRDSGGIQTSLIDFIHSKTFTYFVIVALIVNYGVSLALFRYIMGFNALALGACQDACPVGLRQWRGITPLDSLLPKDLKVNLTEEPDPFKTWNGSNSTFTVCFNQCLGK